MSRRVARGIRVDLDRIELGQHHEAPRGRASPRNPKRRSNSSPGWRPSRATEGEVPHPGNPPGVHPFGEGRDEDDGKGDGGREEHGMQRGVGDHYQGVYRMPRRPTRWTPSSAVPIRAKGVNQSIGTVLSEVYRAGRMRSMCVKTRSRLAGSLA